MIEYLRPNCQCVSGIYAFQSAFLLAPIGSETWETGYCYSALNRDKLTNDEPPLPFLRP